MKRSLSLLPIFLMAMSCIQDPEAPSNLPDAPVLSVDETSVTRVSMLVNDNFGKNMTDITAYGVEISETLFEAGKTYKTLTPQVSGSSFSLGVTDLKSNSTYFLRSFISNGHSKMYSSTITQQTPETSVASISDVTVRDGFLVATIEDNGGRSIEEVGFMWGTSSERKDLKREKRYPGTVSADGKTFTLPLAEVGQGTHFVLAYAEDDRDGTGYSRIPFEFNSDIQPNNEIWYTSIDGTVVEPYNSQAFNVKIVSNTYSDGKGIITFDGDVTEIGHDAFRGLRKLESIHLPGSLLSIGDLAFYRSSIESVNIPESVNYIESGCFRECWKLASFTGKYASSDGKALIMDDTMVGFAPAEKPKSYTIDPDVKEIGKHVFSYCSFLEKVIFPEGLETIQFCAFCSCSSLASLEFPSTLKFIDRCAFSWCSSLSFISFPKNGDFVVEREAFTRCARLSSLEGKNVTQDGRCLVINKEVACLALSGVEEYVIPDGQTSVCTIDGGDDVGYPGLKRLFYPETVSLIGQITYCEDLESITVMAVTPPSFHQEWFWADNTTPTYLYGTNNCSIYVPTESLDAYKAAEGWKDYADRIQPIGEEGNISASKYLTFTSEGTTKLSMKSTLDGDYSRVLYYSYDANTWTRWDFNELEFAANKPLYICGDNPEQFNSLMGGGISTFAAEGDFFNISGDIMSLADRNNELTTIPSEWFFGSLFERCTLLKTAPSLPATTLADYCYCGMFQSCTGLTTAPELPATSLAVGCYGGMFCGSGLTEAPELPATTLAEGCYATMFGGCALKSAPELPAEILPASSYAHMFEGCTQLEYVKCMATDISAENCLTNWVNGVASIGTFVKSAQMNDWPTGESGIPEGWTVEDAQ